MPQARAAPAPALGPAGHAAGGVSRGDPPQPPGQRQQQAKGRPAASGPAAAEFAGMARAYLSERVRGCVAAAVDATKAELEVENGTYAELKEEARAMDAEVQSLVSERVAVDQAAR